MTDKDFPVEKSFEKGPDKPLKEFTKDKREKDIKEFKEFKEKDIKDIKDKDKEKREKEIKEFKEHKEKEFKENKEFKEFKEKDVKEFKEKDLKDNKEKDIFEGGRPPDLEDPLATLDAVVKRLGDIEQRLGMGQSFIRSEERPDVGQQAMADEGEAEADGGEERPKRGR
jgi:hypothetical protein